MSGFVVGFGQPNSENVKKMFGKIRHRGPYLSGMADLKHAIMAQNYLNADIPGTDNKTEVPVSTHPDDVVKICYDGQIGNCANLARQCCISNGTFVEEKLLLELFRKNGSNMFEHLRDAIFAFVISDGKRMVAARDLLGIKTLFYGRKDNTIYFASELKSIKAIIDDIYEFPPGHFMDESGRLKRFSELPSVPPEMIQNNIEEIAEDIRDIIKRSLRSRVGFTEPTAGLLSGGMDSSVIGYLASEYYKEKFGENARLKTFAIGVGESEDIKSARLMAEHIDTDHHELIVDLNQILEAIPEVIYHLESFDPSLVRSSVSNYLISKHAAKHGIELLLSGEGGDEVFCGYNYLKSFPLEELFSRQMECLGFLHSNASLRLDRMNHCNSIRVVAPLISGELLSYAMTIPPEYKQKPEGDKKIEKWIFRKTYEEYIPKEITGRTKQEFSQGSGSAAVLPEYFEDVISDSELSDAQSKFPLVRSKEELFYFRIFTEHFGEDRAVETVGQWITL
jgi:asparagine synthase (glutamine-hydrolysing)